MQQESALCGRSPRRFPMPRRLTLHTILACASITLAALAWLYSVRRVRDVERRLADAEDRLSLAEWSQRDEAAIQDGAHRGMLTRLDRLEKRTACKRIHAADLPEGWVRAPIPVRGWVDDEEAFNPLMRGGSRVR